VGRCHRIVIDQRLLTLCATHARVVKTSGASTMDAVRALFREGSGRRSTLPRRADLDRRAFPPRPEGRRLTAGRRATDVP
jgi:hypothetical protein